MNYFPKLSYERRELSGAEGSGDEIAAARCYDEDAARRRQNMGWVFHGAAAGGLAVELRRFGVSRVWGGGSAYLAIGVG